MDIRLSAHGAYHHQYHLVWIPKYRRRVLKGDLKDFLAKRLGEITEFHPEVQVEQCSIQPDHVHLVAVIPPKLRRTPTAVRIGSGLRAPGSASTRTRPASWARIRSSR